jgi:sulfite reductase alpha subunit-like flavoprotein
MWIMNPMLKHGSMKYCVHFNEQPVAKPAGIKIQPQPETKSNKKIYTGTVVSHVNLHDTGSDKETYHIELLADEVDYLPGDSIGIVYLKIL